MATGNPEGKKQPPDEQRLGPVLRRRDQVQPSTTDQRLLDERAPSDWVHTDPWRVLRIQSEFIEGFGTLAELPRRSACSVPPAHRRAPRSTRRAYGSAALSSTPDGP